jgi:hypothetical protein
LERLSSDLRGPRRIRADLLAELRDGLDDATDDLIASGLAPEQARRRAVAEFGDPASLAAELQVELAGVQARRTALAVALASLLMELAWSRGYPAMMRNDWMVTGHEAAGSPLLKPLSEIQSKSVWIVAPLLLLMYVSIFRRTAAVRGIALAIAALVGGLIALNVVTSSLMTALNPQLWEAARLNPAWLLLQVGSLIAMVALVVLTVRMVRVLARVRRPTPAQE